MQFLPGLDDSFDKPIRASGILNLSRRSGVLP